MIDCNEASHKVVRIFNINGQLLLEKHFSEDEVNLNVNYAHLNYKLLLLQYQSRYSTKTTKLINP